MVFGQKSKAAETRFGQMVSWCLAVDYNLRQLFFWQITTLLCGEVQISRETSTFAYKPQTNVVMFFLLIIFIISMILNIFIILLEFDLPLPIAKKKATNGRKNVFFFSFWYFFPLCWPLCLAIVTLFVVATLSAWWHQRQWQRCSHLKDSRWLWYLVHHQKAKPTNKCNNNKNMNCR